VNDGPDGLDESWRTEDGRSWFRRLGLLRGSRLLAALCRQRMFSKHVATRQRDVALPCESFDERTSYDFLDRARRALQFDPMIAFEQRQNFLARRVE
jgi:hypothetical protein